MCKNRKLKCGCRGISRFYAVQMLYQINMGGDSDRILQESDKNPSVILSDNEVISGIDKTFFSTLLKETLNHLDEIDKIISSRVAKTWTFNRLDKVVQAILRLAVCELRFLGDTPDAVVFNEYIEIAKSFFQKSDVSFINGILNNVAKDKAV